MSEIQLGVVESRFADMIWANEPVSSSVLVKLAGTPLETDHGPYCPASALRQGPVPQRQRHGNGPHFQGAVLLHAE